MKDQTKIQLREEAVRTICNIRRGSMDDKQFRATIEFQIDSLLQSQRDELVEKIFRYCKENGEFVWVKAEEILSLIKQNN